MALASGYRAGGTINNDDQLSSANRKLDELKEVLKSNQQDLRREFDSLKEGMMLGTGGLAANDQWILCLLLANCCMTAYLCYKLMSSTALQFT